MYFAMQIDQFFQNENFSSSLSSLKDVELPDTPHVEYTGPKKPLIPKQRTIQHVSSLKVLASAAVARSLAKQNDLQFFKGIAIDTATPKYSGYNTKNARETGQGLKPKSKTMYLPLIDAFPDQQ